MGSFVEDVHSAVGNICSFVSVPFASLILVHLFLLNAVLPAPSNQSASFPIQRFCSDFAPLFRKVSAAPHFAPLRFYSVRFRFCLLGSALDEASDS